MSANLFNSSILSGYRTGNTVQENSRSVCSEKLTAVDAEQNICISLKKNDIDLASDPYGFSFVILFYKSDKTQIAGLSATCQAELVNGVVSGTFLLPENAAFIHINFASGSIVDIAPDDVGDFMVNYGTQPLPYEPYEWTMRTDRMGIRRPDDGTTDDELYGSLYLIHQRHNNVNDYGGKLEADADKLANIVNAAPGSTCLYSTGRLDRLELDGWATYGG